MSLVKTALLGLTTLLLVVLANGQEYAPVDENCLGCLCEASTKCVNPGYCPNGYCGVFLISHAYWLDTDKLVRPGDSNARQGAFEDCANDLACAANIIRNYMGKHAQDCNGDGVITCTDYVKIHKLGRNACFGPLTGEFGALYESCRSKLGLI
ncbi:hypothetical protein OTU49_016726 [Cherax quadricarinatus]|uniref:lysozyme n=1 Tax=Cherax quadricarinatus TaxID=27406 RepID=A0AAW0Y7D0_CHEQU